MGQRRVRKGFLLTLDAIIAITLLLSLAIFIGGIQISYYSPELKYERLYYMGKDMLLLVENADMNQLSDFPVIEYYINEGVITGIDMQNSLLEVIGSLWASNNATKQEYARNITEGILNETLPENYGYSLLMDGSPIYTKNGTGGNDFVSRFSTIVSGYELGRPVSGYVARAWATKLTKNTTDVFSFFTEGAGNLGGKLEITKSFNINATDIHNAIFYISVHYGTSEEEFENIAVNGANVKNDIVWLHEDEEPGVGTGAFGYVDVTDSIQTGNNTVYLRFKNNVYNSHIHPGMRIEVTYSTEDMTEFSDIVSRRVYFDHIEAGKIGSYGSGAWAMPSFFIPENATIRNVYLHLKAEDIENIMFRDDVRIYYNNDLYDTFNPPANESVDVYYNFTDEAVPGTNWVLAQLNYRISSTWWGEYDDFTGQGDTIIYSDPLDDPEGSSYIDVEYEYPIMGLRYGYIDVGVSENAGGSLENPKEFSVDFEGHEVMESFVHVAQLFSNTVDVDVRPYGGTWYDIFVSPSARAVPDAIYVDPMYYEESGDNDIAIEDTGCWDCYILPESSLEYRIWLPSSVGYGDVNDTLQGALDDAVMRLNETLGKYAIATSIATETYSVSGVPSMWGPAELEVQVWG